MTDVVIMEITGIDGESTISDYPNKINIASFNHGISQPMAINPDHAGRTTGRISAQEFTVSRQMDKASVPIIDSLVTAKNLGVVKIHLLKSSGATGDGQTLYMTYELEETMISNYQVGGGMGTPMETFSLNYTKINWNYVPQESTGALKGTVPSNFSIKLGKKV